MGFKWREHVLCFAEGPRETGVLIALRPQRHPPNAGEQMVTWHDYDHQRAFDIATVLRDDRDCFTFTDSLGRAFVLRPMTLAAYREHVAPHLAGAREFDSEDELRTFLLDAIAAWGREDRRN